MRLKIVLQSSLIKACNASQPSKFWWLSDQSCRTVANILTALKKQLGLPASIHPAVKMDGFVVFDSSPISLLREGDVLHIDIAASQHKRPAADTGGTHTKTAAAAKKQRITPGHTTSAPIKPTDDMMDSSSDESDSSTDSDSSSSSSDDDEDGQQFFTPGDKLLTTEQQLKKRPSRSARRKSAKRRLRRMGIVPNARPVAAQQQNRKTTTTAAAKQNGVSNGKLPNPDFSTSSSSSSSSSSEDSSSSDDDTSSSDSDTSSEEEQHQAPATVTTAAVPEKQQQQTETTHHRMHLEEFLTLPSLQSLPYVGDIVAYRLLEIGPASVPEVSEVRCGQCTEQDEATKTITLAPYPPFTIPYTVPPRDYDGDDYEEEEEEEGFGFSLYDEEGNLTTDMNSFTDIRLVSGTATQQQQQPIAPVQATANGENSNESFKERYSKQGPPKPAAARIDSPAVAVPVTGGWEALAEQLKQKRQELMSSSSQAAAKPQQHQPKGVGGRGVGVRPGARQTAVGGILRMLRATKELEEQ